MNVLFITEFFSPNIFGGGEINIEKLAFYLSEEVNITVLTSSINKKLEEEYDLKIKQKNIKILRVLKSSKSVDSFKGNLERLKFKSSFLKFYNKNKKFFETFDIIHFFGSSIILNEHIKVNVKKVYSIESIIPFCPKGDLIYKSKKVCSGCNKKKFSSCIFESKEIGRMKNYFFLKCNPLFKNFLWNRFENIKKNLSKFDGIIFVSNYIKELYSKSYNFNIKSEVIGNLIYEKEKNDYSIKYESLKKRKYDITYLGSLNYFKGIKIFFESLKLLEEKKLKIAVYGEGSLKKELEEYALKNKLNITFFKPKKYEKIKEIYENTKLIVVPSIVPEAFGRIPLESLYYNTPVITSNAGALKENLIRINKKTVFKHNNPKELKKTIEYILKNIKKIEEIYEEKKIKKVLEEYNKKNITKKTIKFYKKIL